MVTERDYVKIDLTDLACADCPEYVEVWGIARGARQDPYVIGKSYTYSALLHAPKDLFFVHIAGLAQDESGLSLVLKLLTTSSEGNLPVIIRGTSLPEHVDMPGVHHVAEVELGNLRYVAPLRLT